MIGLVCDERGLPVALEVWPGNTVDRSTVGERARALKEQFGIKRAVLVGDAGLYSQANVETLQSFCPARSANWLKGGGGS